MPAWLKPFAFCLVVLCLLALPLWSATDLALSGTVTDPSGGRVAGAIVNLYNTASLLRTARSASDGAFSFAALPPGAYILECSAEGFQKQSRRVLLEDQSAILNLPLAVAGLHQDVSVVASDLPQIPIEVAKSVSLISSEELEERDAVFLSDALSAVPALQIQQLGGPGHLASYRFRGLAPEDTAILLDGFHFEDVADNRGSARPFLSDLLTLGADRIEVLRGAGSTLYGTNAIGGLINVLSAPPSRPFGGYVSLEGGSLGLVQATTGIEGRSRGGRASYAADLAHVNYTRGEDAHDAYRLSAASARSTYQLTPHLGLFAKFSMSDSFALLNQDPAPVPDLPPLPPGQFVRLAIPYPEPGATFYPQLDDPDYRQANRTFQGALRLDFEASSFWSQSLGYQSLRTRRHYDDGPGLSPLAASLGYDQLSETGPRRYDGNLDELFWNNSLTIRSFDSIQVRLGWERRALDQTEFGQTTAAAERAISVRIQNQTRLLDGRLHLELAGQAQYYRLDTPHFTDSTGNPYGAVSRLDVPSTYNGDVAVAYFIGRSHTKMRAHAGNGYRSPSLYERFGSGGSGFYYGNPQLKPERSLFADGGLDQILLGEKLQLSATYFYTHLATILDFGSTPQDAFGRLFGYLNARGGSARGVELSVAARPGARVNLTASYTFTNSDQPAPTSAGTTRVLGLSDHQFTVGVSVLPSRRLHFDWRTYAVSSHDFPLFGALFPFPFGTFQFPGYVRADITGSYLIRDRERSQLRLLARVDNLLNREYFSGGFVAPKATLRAGLRWEF